MLADPRRILTNTEFVTEMTQMVKKYRHTITQRSAIKQMAEFFINVVPEINPNELVLFCSVALHQWISLTNDNVFAVAQMDGEERFDTMLQFKIVCNTLGIQFVKVGQSFFNDAINEYFNEYLHLF